MFRKSGPCGGRSWWKRPSGLRMAGRVARRVFGVAVRLPVRDERLAALMVAVWRRRDRLTGACRGQDVRDRALIAGSRCSAR